MRKIVEDLQSKITEIFKHLHSHPEISWEEYGTRDYIQQILRDYPCQMKTIENSPGFIVEVGKGKPVVALRADMDALWQEVNGVFQANHSCGHDAHMTIAIGCLLTMMKKGLPDRGTFRFIFQPAEEKGTGALHMVDKGMVDDVDYLYGMHLRPIEELRLNQFAPALQHGAARFMEGKIIGEDAHGARPHLNKNAILIGTEFFQHLNNIYVNPKLSNSLKMTAFHAGGKNTNIIPGNATFAIDIRAETNELMEELTNKVYRIGEMLSTYHQVDIKLEINANIPAAVINEKTASILQEAIMESVGEEMLAPKVITTGGDDFHFYTIKRPNLKATMLAVGCDLKPGLHHPNMTFEFPAILQAIEILTRGLLKTVEKEVSK